MADDDVQAANFKHVEGGWQGQIEQSYDHDIQEVWAALTTPEVVAQWIATAHIDLRQGGRVHIDFEDSGLVIDSVITQLDAPHLIEYSWSQGDEPQRPLTWALQPEGAATHLTLTVRIPESEDIVKAVAGFSGHLQMLAGVLEGVPIKFPFNHYMAARKVYTELAKGLKPA